MWGGWGGLSLSLALSGNRFFGPPLGGKRKYKGYLGGGGGVSSKPNPRNVSQGVQGDGGGGGYTIFSNMGGYVGIVPASFCAVLKDRSPGGGGGAEKPILHLRATPKMRLNCGYITPAVSAPCPEMGLLRNMVLPIGAG